MRRRAARVTYDRPGAGQGLFLLDFHFVTHNIRFRQTCAQTLRPNLSNINDNCTTNTPRVMFGVALPCFGQLIVQFWRNRISYFLVFFLRNKIINPQNAPVQRQADHKSKVNSAQNEGNLPKNYRECNVCVSFILNNLGAVLAKLENRRVSQLLAQPLRDQMKDPRKAPVQRQGDHSSHARTRLAGPWLRPGWGLTAAG